MEVHHASLGRQKLEEIRLKRAAERLTKASSSGSDLETLNPYGMRRSESGSGIAERESHGLYVRVKELEKKNTELEDENKKLLSKLDSKDVESDSLLKRMNNLEQYTLPSLRKALKDISIEKDTAVVAREDLLAQLRMIRKRLKEAEEDQYRAEEDAAALRAELISLQQQDMRNPFGDIPSMTNPEDQVRTIEAEILNLKLELQQELLLRQQEQIKLAEEQFRVSSLMAEKLELEERLINLSQKSTASQEAVLKAFSTHDKEKLEKQLHDMALMVERLEGSRQKLMLEIDSQSTEIERLFEENSHLSVSYEDAVGAAAQWENQVKVCLKQNEELRGLLDKLRLDQACALHTSERDVQLGLMTGKDGNMFDPSANTSENLLLKENLAKEQSRAEALSAEVMHLSAKLKHAVQSFNNLRQHYRPVLRSIENDLMKMKQ